MPLIEAAEKMDLLRRKVLAVKKAHTFQKAKEAEEALEMIVDMMADVVQLLKEIPHGK